MSSTTRITLEDLIRQVDAPPDGRALIAQFVPPPRFASKRFETYKPSPAHPSQREALERLRALAASLHEEAGRSALSRRLRAALGMRRRGGGIYLDGGFGVGKTHLLAALWNAAPGPKAYLTFDELVFTIGLLGVAGTREAFSGMGLVAVDEWELDDPGNLQMAVAFLRGALADGVQVATTSNTIPDELGNGRFPQKDFKAEIEEMAAAFEVLRVSGDDFRNRHFTSSPGLESFLTPEALATAASRASGRVVYAPFRDVLGALARVHPIRYAAMVRAVDALFIQDLEPIDRLPEALRWVHFIDKLYDAAIPVAMSSHTPLSELFPESFLRGPYGKKFSRCLSRLAELVGPGSPHHALALENA